MNRSAMKRPLKSEHDSALPIPILPERSRSRVGIDQALGLLSLPSELEAEGFVAAAVEIGMRIKHARLGHGMTQAQLAKLAGLSQPALSAIENGRGKDGPNYATLRAVGDVFGLEIMPLPRTSGNLELSMTFDDPAADSPEPTTVENVGPMLRSMIAPKLLEQIRMMTRSAESAEGPRLTHFLTIGGHGSANVRVEPMTAVIVHGCEPVTWMAPGEEEELELIHGGDGETVAITKVDGNLAMHNSGDEPVWVMTVPSAQFAEE